MDNYLITGIPRSGTSLLVSLCQNNKTICLSEPEWLKTLKDNSSNGIIFSNNLLLKIKELRNNIQNNRAIELIYGREGTKLPTNYFPSKENRLSSPKNKQPINVVLPKKASTFPFYIKANAIFMATLQHYINNPNYKICVIIRDPLAVIKSWNSVNIASSKGKVKSVEKFSTRLEEIGLMEELLDRQIQLVDWYFKQVRFLEMQHLIFYENFVNNPSYYLKKHLNINLNNPTPLHNRNNNAIYNNEMDELIKHKLSSETSHVSTFYPAYST